MSFVDYFIITLNTVNRCRDKCKSTRFFITYPDEQFKFLHVKLLDLRIIPF